MHMQGEPGTMQLAPSYRDVVAEVRSFLDERVRVLLDNGVSRQRIVVDPGFGFGKTLDHNLALLRHLEVFGESGFPVFVGMSRKTMLGAITGREVSERVFAGAAAALLAVQRGHESFGLTMLPRRVMFCACGWRWRQTGCPALRHNAKIMKEPVRG
jgi:dihydropteroate synthase